MFLKENGDLTKKIEREVFAKLGIGKQEPAPVEAEAKAPADNGEAKAKMAKAGK